MFDTLDGKVLRSFEVMKKVGQGAYGQVWKARNKRTGTVCALKKIYEAFRNASDAQKAYREIRYLQKLDHPSIVKLLAVHRPLSSRDVYLELEFMEADLCVALKNSVLKEIHKHYIFYQLANTLSYLHAAELLHRDIKPSNVLVNETCEVKLCDFGLIRSLSRDSPEEQVLTENIATRWYRAPEILLCSNSYGKPIDVWSLGCVLAEMVMQRPIFQGSSTLSQLEKIFEVTGKPLPEDLHYIRSKSSLNVIENMEIKERRSIRDLLNTSDKHLVDLLERIFQVDPRKRPTAA
jgi:mitogen-activated protein kinase 15